MSCSSCKSSFVRLLSTFFTFLQRYSVDSTAEILYILEKRLLHFSVQTADMASTRVLSPDYHVREFSKTKEKGGK